MRCIHLYARSETSSTSIKFFKVTSGFLARSLKLNFMANMIFKGTRMKIILFYLDFLCRFQRAIIPLISGSIYTVHVIFFPKGLGDLTLSSKTRVRGCQSNLDLSTVLKLRGSDHLASALLILLVINSLSYVVLVLQFYNLFAPSLF